MHIVVAPYAWGESETRDIRVLLEDTASHTDALLRSPFTGTIVVVQAPLNDRKPRTHYRSSQAAPFFIQLTAADAYWAQFAYQFSHEFCHVLSDYERLGEGSNGWLHEAICELASVFTLRRMAGTWSTNPPYPNWIDYADALASYVEEYLSCEERQLPAGMTLAAWLQTEEKSLRSDRYQRDKNAVVAHSLLPIFESEPAGWNAIRRLPASSSMLMDYLVEWEGSVDPQDRPFVRRIRDAFQ